MTASKTVPPSVLASLTEEVFQKGGHFSFQVRGISMRPLLKDGDRLEVGPVQDGALSPGSLLVYRRSSEEIVVHRLMEIVRRDTTVTYRISPDSAPLCPEAVSSDQILGVVERVFRGRRELFLKRGWRGVWRRFLLFGYRNPLVLRLFFRAGKILHTPSNPLTFLLFYAIVEVL